MNPNILAFAIMIIVALAGAATALQAPINARLATAVGSEVAVCTTAGQVFMIDAATGKVRWAYRTTGQILHTPAVTADRLLVPAQDGVVHGIRIGDGTALYGIRCTARPATPATASAGLVAFADDGAVVRVHRADSGVPVCEHRLGHGQPSGVVLTPAAAPTTALVEAGGQLVAIDLAGNRVRYTVPTGDGNRSQPVSAGGIVCVATAFSQLYAVST